MSIDCRCTTVEELTGAEAVEYSKKHLREVLINMTWWQTLYECPRTLRWFLLDRPDSGYHGGGVPVLKRL